MNLNNEKTDKANRKSNKPTAEQTFGSKSPCLPKNQSVNKAAGDAL